MKILTSFNHPYVISDLHDLLSSVEYKSHIVQPTTGCHMVWPTTSCGATIKAKFYNQCGETKYCMSSGATNKAMWSGQQSHMVQPTLAPIVWKKNTMEVNGNQNWLPTFFKIDFHCMDKFYSTSQWKVYLLGLLQNIFFCVPRKKIIK